MILKNSLKAEEVGKEMIVAVAKRMGIPTLELENNLLQLGYGRYKCILDGVISERASYLGIKATQSEEEMRSFLAGLGFSVSHGLSKEDKGLYRLLVIGNKVLRAKDLSNREDLDLNRVGKENKDLAIRAISSLGLEIAEVYISASRVGKEVRGNCEGIVKIDAAPLLTDERLIEELLTFLRVDRIPIISFMLSQKESFILDIFKKICEDFGLRVGLDKGGMSSDQKVILRDDRMELALFSNCGEQILKDGLSYEGIDIGVISKSIGEDFGADSSYRVKEIMEENLLDSGYLILEVDDRDIFSIFEQGSDYDFIFSSLDPNNILIRNHIRQKGAAVYLLDGNIVLFDEEEELPVVSLAELKGEISEDLIRKIMLVIGVSFAHHIPIFIVRSALLGFLK